MAELPSEYKFVILFALIACHAFILGEGRQIKSTNKKDAGAVQQEFQRKAAEGSSINLRQSYAERKQDFRPSQPSGHGNSAEHNIVGKKEIFPPVSFGDSAALYKDNFRPTTPGNGPGVGHKHAKKEEDDFQPATPGNSPGVGHKRAKEEGDDFRPTTPGNSPGVGHKRAKEEEDDFRPTAPGNSPGVGHKHAEEEEDDFRPTTPGNSPGVGHKHAKEEEDHFRPTTPGNSPGVGHKHGEEEENVESKAQGDHSLTDAKYSLTEFQNDFRPTAPGHSPGVGHSLSNKKKEPKA